MRVAPRPRGPCAINDTAGGATTLRCAADRPPTAPLGCLRTFMMDYHTLKAHNAALNQEELRAGCTVLQSKPIEFWFDLCGPCNLHCAHCAYRLHGRSSEQDVSEP